MMETYRWICSKTCLLGVAHPVVYPAKIDLNIAHSWHVTTGSNDITCTICFHSQFRLIKCRTLTLGPLCFKFLLCHWFHNETCQPDTGMSEFIVTHTGWTKLGKKMYLDQIPTQFEGAIFSLKKLSPMLSMGYKA